MKEDPIVAEVHRAREALVAGCNFDVKTFFEGLRKRQTALGARLVRQDRASQAPTGVALPVSPTPQNQPLQTEPTTHH